MRASNLLSEYPEEKFVDCELYHEESFSKILCEPIPGDLDNKSHKNKWTNDDDLSKLLNIMCSFAILNQGQERFLFQKMNYCKFRASELRKKIVAKTHTRQNMNDFVKLRKLALETRNTILNHNMRLVVDYLSKKGLPETIVERIGEATFTAFSAIDCFDWRKGFKFSTYIVNSLHRSCRPWIGENICRLIHKTRNITVLDSDNTSVETYGGKVSTMEDFVIDHRESIMDEKHKSRMRRAMMNSLIRFEKGGDYTKRLAEIIRMRFAIKAEKMKTNNEVGIHFNISKERSRQLTIAGLRKLRDAAIHRYPELTNLKPERDRDD